MDPRSPYTLVGVDIAGEWNRPLLVNAARLSGCSCAFARSDGFAKANKGSGGAPDDDLEVLLQGFQRIVACEATKKSVGLYDFPAPREQTAVLVGNEEAGLPRAVLKRADSIVSIPMACSALSSLNVAVAGAIVLYALTRDLGRRKQRRRYRCGCRVWTFSSRPRPIHTNSVPCYAVSMPSAGAGCSCQTLTESGSPRILESSSPAGRRHDVPGISWPSFRGEFGRPHTTRCWSAIRTNPEWRSRGFSSLECERLLVVIGSGKPLAGFEIPATLVTVDFVERSVTARMRHAGSILLSVVASMLDT